MMRLVARGAVRVANIVVLMGLKFAVEFANLLGLDRGNLPGIASLPGNFREALGHFRCISPETNIPPDMAILHGATRQNGDGN
jgi:hypothetical protein